MHGEAGVWVHERLPWLEVGFYGFCHSVGSMSRTKRETDSRALQQDHERGVIAGSIEATVCQVRSRSRLKGCDGETHCPEHLNSRTSVFPYNVRTTTVDY